MVQTMKKVMLGVLLAFTLSISATVQAEEPEQTFINNWVADNLFEDNWAIITDDYIQINPEAGLLTLYIPNTQFHLFTKGGQESFIQFETGGTTYPLSDYYDSNWGAVTIDLTEAPFTNYFEFRILIMQTWETPPGGYLDFMNTRSYYTFTEPAVARFYHLDELWYEEDFIGFITGPPENPPTLIGDNEFAYFEDQSARIFRPDRLYKGDQVFYSVYEAGVSLFPNAPSFGVRQDADIIERPLAAVGLWNEAGIATISLMIMAFISAIMVYHRLPAFAVFIVNGFIIGLFIFIGMLPFWIAFIFFVLFGVYMASMIKSDVTGYE